MLLISTGKAFFFVRVFALFRVFSSNLALTMNVAVGLSMFSMPLVFLEAVQSGTASLTYSQIMGYALRGVALGAGLGVLAGLPIVVLESMGQIIDNQRNFVIEGSTNVIDREYSSHTQNILTGLIALVFFHLDFHLWVMEFFYATFAIGDSFTILGGAASLKNGILAIVRFYAPLMWLILPLIIFFISTDVVLGYVAKRMPTLNVFEVAGSLKSILFAIGLAAAFYVLIGDGGDNMPIREMIGPLPGPDELFGTE